MQHKQCYQVCGLSVELGYFYTAAMGFILTVGWSEENGEFGIKESQFGMILMQFW